MPHLKNMWVEDLMNGTNHVVLMILHLEGLWIELLIILTSLRSTSQDTRYGQPMSWTPPAKLRKKSSLQSKCILTQSQGQEKTNKGKKPGKTRILTDTAVKKEIEEEKLRREENIVSKKTIQQNQKTRFQKNVELDDDLSISYGESVFNLSSSDEEELIVWKKMTSNKNFYHGRIERRPTTVCQV